MAQHPTKVPRLYHNVMEKLIELIESAQYSVGMRLPAERELAAKFGVSRPTVREAIIALEIENYVEVRVGSGVYIIENTHGRKNFYDKDIGPFELTEARVLFEGEAAALAATMITEEELSNLTDILSDMAAENDSDIDDHEATDKKFHMAIAKATRNSAIVSVIEELWDARENSMLTRRMYQKVRERGVKPSIDEHRKIYKALKEHNGKKARNAMRSHLERVIDGILDATEIEAIEAAQKQSAKHRERFNLTRTMA